MSRKRSNVFMSGSELEGKWGSVSFKGHDYHKYYKHVNIVTCFTRGNYLTKTKIRSDKRC